MGLKIFTDFYSVLLFCILYSIGQCKAVQLSSSIKSISCNEASNVYTDDTQQMTYALQIKWLLFVLKQKADKQHKK